MKKLIILSGLLILTGIMNLCNAYFNLTVGDPRSSWWTYTGTINEAKLSVKPKGLFMEYGLYLTFSANGSYFSGTDTLEVVLDFDLPEKAIITDSWLWIGENISKAKIMDQWTATMIYEDIVKRRRDPSILYKINQTQYRLRIFPMAGTDSRKVKITYLMPATWNAEKVSSVIPAQIFTTSNIPMQNVEIITWDSDQWKNPLITGNSEVVFASKTNSEFGDHLSASIPYANLSGNPSIAFTSPMKNGYYLSKYEKSSEEGVYQLAVLPSHFLDAIEYKKVAVLFDYDISNSNITKDYLFSCIKSLLLSQLNDKDSFNLIFSNLQIQRVSNNWLPADSATISNTFKNLNNPLSNYSNLVSLIGDGIEFINSSKTKGQIILITNSDQYGTNQTANPVITDLIDMMDFNIPIHIADYQNQDFQYYWFGGRYYYGNEYFNTNLSKQSRGSYQKIDYNNSLYNVVQNCLNHLNGQIKSFDLYSSLNNGICFGRYDLNSKSEMVYIGEPILQIGKYKGQFPFEFKLSGEYNDIIFTRDVSVDTEADSADFRAIDMWTGLYLQKLESEAVTNEVITEIINNSIKERILSLYTAFICLEDTTFYCEKCEDEEGGDDDPIITDIHTKNLNKPVLSAFPNPFDHEISITIKTEENIDLNESVFEIYDLSGALIHSFTEYIPGDNEYTFTWDGFNSNGEEMNSGVYIFVMKTTSGIFHLKLIKI